MVKSLIEFRQCFSALVFSMSKDEIIVEKVESSMENVESPKRLLEGIETVDDDLAALEAAHEEWRYALAHKGIECIEPIPIEPTCACPPPDGFKNKHFNVYHQYGKGKMTVLTKRR